VTTHTVGMGSEWVRRIEYRPTTRLDGSKTGRGVVVVHLKRGGCLEYRGVDSWRVGLMLAHGSPGRAYNLHLKGRYEYAKREPRATRPSMDMETLLRRSILVEKARSLKAGAEARRVMVSA